MSLFLDVEPLRKNRDFARLWCGGLVSGIGDQITSYSLIFEVWKISHSSASVGAIGLSIAIPRILFACFGGVLADFAERRKLVLFCTVGLVLISFALAAGAVLQSEGIWIFYLVVGVKALLSSFIAPARSAIAMSLLRKDEIKAGVGLNQASSEWSVFLGPLLAGLLVQRYGLAVCFLVDGVSYLASLYGVYRAPKGGVPAKAPLSASAMSEGIRYIWAKPALLGVLLADLSATVLAYPVALLPALNSARFHGDPGGLSYLLGAMALGGLVASFLSGIVTRNGRPGILVLAATALWSISLGLVGATESFSAVLVLLFVAGYSDSINVTARGVVLQSSVADAFRGRVTAVSQTIGNTGPYLGNFRAGVVGSVFGAGTALCLGGMASLICVVAIFGSIPAVRRYIASEKEERVSC